MRLFAPISIFIIVLLFFLTPFRFVESRSSASQLSAFSQADSDTFVNYFPLNTGDWRRYEYTYMSYPPELGGQLFVFDSLLIGGILYYGIGSDSLHLKNYRMDSLGNVIQLFSNGERVIYPFGSFENDSFMIVDSVYGYTTLITVTGRNETCSSIAGSFQNCMSIFVDNLSLTDVEQWITFAPNVGIVTEGGGTWRASLHSAKIGTTFYGEIIGVDNKLFSQIPEVYNISQNYPNPFNPVTNISYSLPVSGDVTLIIYNLLGEEVARLVDGLQQAGEYQTQWNASNFASGIYFYRLQAGDFVQTRKMVLLK